MEHARARGWSWHWTTCAADASDIAQRASPEDRVIAGGGDGTVHAVVQGLMRAPAPAVLGALPLGTGNDLVRTLGFSLDPERALAEIDDTSMRAFDVARVSIADEVRYVINSSAGGLSVEVDRIVEPDSKARWGPFAYVLGALDLIGDPPHYDVAIRIDDQLVDHLRCCCFVATNGPTVGGGLQVAPTADPEDGLFDLLVVESGPRVALAALGAQLKNGQVLSSPLARHYVGRTLEISGDPTPINLDGEVIGDLSSIRYEVLPRVLRVSTGPGYRLASAEPSAAVTSRSAR